jgi:hypothetical protein
MLKKKKKAERSAAISNAEDATAAKSKRWPQRVSTDAASRQNSSSTKDSMYEQIAASELPIIEPFFATLGAEKITVVAINCVLNRVLSDPKGHGTASLAIAIGNALMAEINLKDPSLHTVLFKRFSPLYLRLCITTSLL